MRRLRSDAVVLRLQPLSVKQTAAAFWQPVSFSRGFSNHITSTTRLRRGIIAPEPGCSEVYGDRSSPYPSLWACLAERARVRIGPARAGATRRRAQIRIDPAGINRAAAAVEIGQCHSRSLHIGPIALALFRCARFRHSGTSRENCLQWRCLLNYPKP